MKTLDPLALTPAMCPHDGGRGPSLPTHKHRRAAPRLSLRVSLRVSLLSLLVCVLAGCAGTDWSRNVYEGVRQRQQSEPDAGAKPPLPDYERYRRERETAGAAARE